MKTPRSLSTTWLILSILALPAVLVPGPAVASSPQQCEAEALARPGHLSGGYQTYTVPNDNWYNLRGALKALNGCNTEGTRKVRFFQQKEELGVGLHPKLEWIYNGLSVTVTTNQARDLNVATRAAHQCWPRPIGGYGNLDKKRHIKGRPAVTVTWTPKHGKPVSKTYHGTAHLVC